MSPRQKSKPAEPMDTPPTEEEFAQMARGWALWEAEPYPRPLSETGEWGFDLFTVKTYDRVMAWMEQELQREAAQ